MNEADIAAMMVACIPEWAIKRYEGVLEMGTQLPTKDGRRVGNAHIIDIMPAMSAHFQTAYTVLTDAGNRLVLTVDEIKELFHEPMWVADFTEVIVRFSRE